MESSSQQQLWYVRLVGSLLVATQHRLRVLNRLLHLRVHLIEDGQDTLNFMRHTNLETTTHRRERKGERGDAEEMEVVLSL